MNRTSVDAYLRDGCGRCDKYRTPECKVHRWTAVLEALRALLRELGLTEEMKWGSPCYTANGKNVVTLGSLDECCALGFFDGAALDDEARLLVRPGPNTRLARRLELRSVEELEARRAEITRLVRQAAELRRTGTKVTFEGAPEALPAELERRLTEDAALRRAFDALTPGRQRSHAIYVAGAKASEARARRVERCAEKIAAGKGWHDR